MQSKANKAMTKQDKKQHKEFRECRRKGRGKAWSFA